VRFDISKLCFKADVIGMPGMRLGLIADETGEATQTPGVVKKEGQAFGVIVWTEDHSGKLKAISNDTCLA
jgi:hypothetical protein